MDNSILSDSHFDVEPIAADDQDLLPDDIFDDNPTNGNTALQQRTNQATPRFVSSVIDQEARDQSLTSELEHVQKLNQLISNVNETLEGAMSNMVTVSNAVNSANTLLDLYIRVLSQSTHNSRLILNGRWQGSSADLAAIENESQNKIYEAERRRTEQAERAAAAAEREREERAREAARKEQEADIKRGSTRGRKTPGSRSGSSQGGNYGQVSSTTGLPLTGSTRGIPRGRYTSRSASGIGRSIGRGTGRGVR